MEDKFPIVVSEGGRVCAGGGFSSGGFCVDFFNLSIMVDRLLNGVDKFPIGSIDGAIDKEEGLPTHSELFSIIFFSPG